MSEPYVLTPDVIKLLEPPAEPKEPRMTNRQLDFLRNLKKHPNSLPLLTWPRATTLRKWMRRPRFRAAIVALEEAFAVESRLLMSGAAAQAAMHVQATLSGGSIAHSGQGITPRELELYRTSMKQNLQVLWMEMTRKQQSHRAGLETEVLRRMAEQAPVTQDASDDVESTPEYVI